MPDRPVGLGRTLDLHPRLGEGADSASCLQPQRDRHDISQGARLRHHVGQMRSRSRRELGRLPLDLEPEGRRRLLGEEGGQTHDQVGSPWAGVLCTLGLLTYCPAALAVPIVAEQWTGRGRWSISLPGMARTAGY